MTLDINAPLGSYPDQDEFQVGSTLIWIKIPPHGQRGYWLIQGKLLFDAIWAAVPEALHLAEQVSRRLNPDFWSVYDSRQLSGQPLAVWGISINPETGKALYDININHYFQSSDDNLPNLSEESIDVGRNKEGYLKIEV